MMGEACLPSNAYYPRTPDYTLCSGVHVCWSEHSDSSLVYGFMILDYGFGTITATTSDNAFLQSRTYFQKMYAVQERKLDLTSYFPRYSCLRQSFFSILFVSPDFQIHHNLLIKLFLGSKSKTVLTEQSFVSKNTMFGSNKT